VEGLSYRRRAGAFTSWPSRRCSRSSCSRRSAHPGSPTRRWPEPPRQAPAGIASSYTTVPVIVDEVKGIADKGCTVCVDVCPLDILRINDQTKKAYMAYDECWYCMPCEADCPTGAVTVNIPYLLK
jgi:NAD-dependent dihydropyrimidine dehydrogenase PreA subunit